MNTVALHSWFEASFESARGCENPVQDVSIEVQLEWEGAEITTNAFWDVERTWRARVSPAGDIGLAVHREHDAESSPAAHHTFVGLGHAFQREDLIH